MAQEGEILNPQPLDSYCDFKDKADYLWKQWVEASNTENSGKWDQAFESYVTQMEELRMAFETPSGRPRKRP